VAAHVGITTTEPILQRGEGDNLIKSFMFNDVVLLESMEIVKAINRYLLYQDSRNFKHLCMLKDSYEQMMLGAIDPAEDFEQRAKNRKHATTLLEEIEEWEQRVADNNSELKEAMGEIKQRVGGRENKSLRVEDNLASDVHRK